MVNGRGFGGVDLLVGDGGLVAAVGAFGAQGVPLAVAQGAVLVAQAVPVAAAEEDGGDGFVAAVGAVGAVVLRGDGVVALLLGLGGVGDLQGGVQPDLVGFFVFGDVALQDTFGKGGELGFGGVEQGLQGGLGGFG